MQMLMALIYLLAFPSNFSPSFGLMLFDVQFANQSSQSNQISLFLALFSAFFRLCFLETTIYPCLLPLLMIQHDQNYLHKFLEMLNLVMLSHQLLLQF
uniref:Secreted protein n=1 Tax=Panstrongylus lignarius TaxID=156445 RepID=A0A224Y2Q6_9HEMI